ncbi:F-box protein [Sporobolomyces koalae]|uniref:F-box protein n=1 Tax=Sporobolomyces koalae TaxID=500713 RepID=UPI00318255E9
MPPKKRKDLDSDYEPEVEKTSHSTRRSTTKPTGRVKRERRAPKPVPHLPLDLVWEICTRLEFCDLFSLSRTCSNFRTVLTQPEASALFKQARARDGIPELSVSMDDLSYAALLFSKNCYFCAKKSGGKIDPNLRVRVCVNCKTDVLVYPTEAQREYYHPYTFKVALFSYDGLRRKEGYGPFYYQPHLDHVSDDLNARFPETRSHAPLPVGPYRSSLHGHEDDRGYAFAIFANPENPQLQTPKGDFQEWAYSQAVFRQARREDAKFLQNWDTEVEEAARDKVRSDRYHEITRRFEALGFVQVEFEHPDFKDHKLVNCQRRLTESAWNSNVRQELENVLLSNRSRSR